MDGAGFERGGGDRDKFLEKLGGVPPGLEGRRYEGRLHFLARFASPVEHGFIGTRSAKLPGKL